MIKKIITVEFCVVIGTFYRIAIDVMIGVDMIIGLLLLSGFMIPLYVFLKLNEVN